MALAPEQVVLAEYLNAEYTKPPEIANLRQWGATVLGGGKHTSKTMEEVYAMDTNYAILMARKF